MKKGNRRILLVLLAVFLLLVGMYVYHVNSLKEGALGIFNPFANKKNPIQEMVEKGVRMAGGADGSIQKMVQEKMQQDFADRINNARERINKANNTLSSDPGNVSAINDKLNAQKELEDLGVDIREIFDSQAPKLSEEIQNLMGELNDIAQSFPTDTSKLTEENIEQMRKISQSGRINEIVDRLMELGVDPSIIMDNKSVHGDRPMIPASDPQIKAAQDALRKIGGFQLDSTRIDGTNPYAVTKVGGGATGIGGGGDAYGWTTGGPKWDPTGLSRDHVMPIYE